MKTIDLTKCKAGDKLVTAHGDTMVYSRQLLDVTRKYPHVLIFSSSESYFNDSGRFNLNVLIEDDINRIVEILPKLPNFDFSVLPADCDMISIGGVVYKKTFQWVAQ